MRALILAFAVAVLSIAGQAKAQTLQQQAMCATQAKKYFDEQFPDGSADYQSHYNTKLGKCLLLIRRLVVPGAEVQVIRQLVDAFERHIYADYLWMSAKGKKYWEVKPITCEFTPALSEKRYCESENEFNALISPLMSE
jgi:hypothetical protein